ncbi:FAD binding domain-containing protein [Acuticoccus kandeliae]|uniref:FAD binding domain-containing protein n=1 Tax=Acuticoccus kandeliae TaxID=2073160 RepID=UPI001475DC93|nr:FAD binding domain-containing protein [Acuticoccus kandeliae]
MKAASFEYRAPGSIDEAVRLLAEHGDEARLLAGGQSLVPAIVSRLARPAILIDLNRLPQAGKAGFSAGRLRIPPLMRHADFARIETGGALGPLLAELAGHVGPLPIQLRGTFCGALAHADPAAEWCLATVVLGAEMLVRSDRRGVRNITAASFFDSMLSTTIADDEMLVEVQIPLLTPTTRHGFAEVSRRTGDYALASCLVVYDRDEDEMTKVRLGVGGVEATPRRFEKAERALEDCAPSRSVFRDIADSIAESVDPISDIHADADYRRELTRAVVFRALESSLK